MGVNKNVESNHFFKIGKIYIKKKKKQSNEFWVT